MPWFKITTPVTQRQTRSASPSPTHCPQGPLTSCPATLNLRPLRLRQEYLHYTQRDHAPEVHGQCQIVVLHGKSLKQRGKRDHTDVSENLRSPSEEWSLPGKAGPTTRGVRVGTAKTLTEKLSVKPNDLRKRADSVTERVNAMLPSPVF